MADTRFYVRIRGRLLGPLSVEDLKALRDRGQLSRFHEVSEDRQNWVSAASMPELFTVPETATGRQRGGDVQAPEPAQHPPPAGSGHDPGKRPPHDGWFYLDHEDMQQGPVTWDDLQGLWMARRVSDPTLVWNQAVGDWQPFASLASSYRRTALESPVSDRQRRSRRARDTTEALEAALSWRGPQTGVTFALVGMFFFIAAAVLAGLGVLIAVTETWRTGMEGFAVCLILAGICTLAGHIAETVGFGFCAGGIQEGGARELAIGSLVLGIASTLFMLVLFALVISAFGERGGVVLGIISAFYCILNLCKQVVFLFYLRSMAGAMRLAGLKANIGYLMILYAAMNLFNLVLFLVNLVETRPAWRDWHEAEGRRVVLVLLGLIVLSLSLTWVVWYIVVLFQVRTRLAGFANRR